MGVLVGVRALLSHVYDVPSYVERRIAIISIAIVTSSPYYIY